VSETAATEAVQTGSAPRRRAPAGAAVAEPTKDTRGYVKDERYYFNLCTKCLARVALDRRHDKGDVDIPALRASVCEPWRFPFVDGYRDPEDPEVSRAFNQVSFVYLHTGPADQPPREVSVAGTFAPLYDPIPLQRLSDTPYWVITVRVPKAQLHRYRFNVDGRWLLDPINPQEVTQPNGTVWSQFFTDACPQRVTLQEWEVKLLERMADQILPLRTKEGQNFLERYVDFLDRQARDSLYPAAYRFDRVIGAVNYIDKILAREESHRRRDYAICLEIIDRLLRQRNPIQDIDDMPRGMFTTLYDQMATNVVPGWEYNRYGDPRFFLSLLRRHVYTGAFCHPKYGGNTGAAGWAYLAERFLGKDGATLFAWRANCEKPLGLAEDYNG
jgi:Gluconate 2-dehydrogenase subunit 3/Glycogen recognition site of AMP-activated protein kinase